MRPPTPTIIENLIGFGLFELACAAFLLGADYQWGFLRAVLASYAAKRRGERVLASIWGAARDNSPMNALRCHLLVTTARLQLIRPGWGNTVVLPVSEVPLVRHHPSHPWFRGPCTIVYEPAPGGTREAMVLDGPAASRIAAILHTAGMTVEWM